MLLAYLIAKAVDRDSWSGGLLVTDKRGLPVDFRYVEPIRPGRIQKIIYGGALKRYLLLDAIAGTLLKAGSVKADFIFTSDEILLELDERNYGRFVVVSNGEKEPLDAVGDWEEIDSGKIILQTAPSGPPATLHFHARDESETKAIADKLASLTVDMDFTEPIKRVGEALVEICQKGTD